MRRRGLCGGGDIAVVPAALPRQHEDICAQHCVYLSNGPTATYPDDGQPLIWVHLIEQSTGPLPRHPIRDYQGWSLEVSQTAFILRGAFGAKHSATP